MECIVYSSYSVYSSVHVHVHFVVTFYPAQMYVYMWMIPTGGEKKTQKARLPPSHKPASPPHACMHDMVLTSHRHRHRHHHRRDDKKHLGPNPKRPRQRRIIRLTHRRRHERLPRLAERIASRRQRPAGPLLERLRVRRLDEDEVQRLLQDLQRVHAQRRRHEGEVLVELVGRGRRGGVAGGGDVVDLGDGGGEFGHVEGDGDLDGDGEAADGGDEDDRGAEGECHVEVEVFGRGGEGGRGEG